jgi:dihydropteroate synthase
LYPDADLPLSTTAVMTAAQTVDEAIAAGHAGARLLDTGDAGPALIAAIRARLPEAIICGGETADITRDRHLALRTEAGLICESVTAAGKAAADGVPAGHILVMAAPGMLDGIIGAGWRTLTDVDSYGHGPAGAEAIAAVCAWLGAAVVRTAHVTEIRRSLDMAEAIAGTRPPAWAIRGLA